MNLMVTINEQINKLSAATEKKYIKWERNQHSASCSCEYKGKLLIIAKYSSDYLAEYYVLDGFDPDERSLTTRVFPQDSSFSKVKSFYGLVLSSNTLNSKNE